MGLDSIFFYGTAAAAMTALAPTSAVIKGTSGDAYIVGYSAISGTDNNHMTLTCPGDPRWEAGGVRLNPGVVNTTAPGQSRVPCWFPVKIPIRQGATLVCTQDGADDNACVIYVDYPQFGEPFKARDPAMSQPTAFMTTKTATAGAAVTAFVIADNSVGVTDFSRGRSYTPIAVTNSGAMTMSYYVGLRNTKHQLITFWPVPLTPISSGVHHFYPLPYGLGTVDGGETLWVAFWDETADTPVARIHFAYQA